MKILFFLPSLSIGGLEKVQVTIANALSRRGHHVTVMTFDEDSTLAAELDSNIRFIHRPPKYRLLKRIPKIRYYFDDGLWETRATPKALYKYYVGREKYDVEIAFFRGRAIKTISGSTNKDSVKVAWVHNDFRKASGYMANFNNIDEVRRAYSTFDHVVCVSNEARKGFIETIDDTGNLTTIYNLLPTTEILAKASEMPSIVIPRQNFNILLVGRLADNVKGQCRLIDAVTYLHNGGIEMGLTLVGDGPDRQNIDNHISFLVAHDYIHMVGNQVNPYPYIRQADLLVCASYYEGYNLTVAEALILGTPVLSTRCTGPVEILDDGKYGMIVENTTEGLTGGLRRLATNPELLISYRNAASQRNDFFDEQKIISQIEQLFSK